MTGIFLLDAATLAVSLFNTILLLWLALAIALNAERRTLGMWFAGASLLCATAFFVSHTVILVLGLSAPAPKLDFWWRIGLLAVSVLPFGWYMVTLWYAGFFDVAQTSKSALRKRLGLIIATLVNIAQIVLLMIANPLPTFAHVLNLNIAPSLNLGGVPLLLIVFALNLFLSIALSFDALSHPAPMTRALSNLARTRARPWLIATSASLILIAVLVTGLMAWTLLHTVPVYFKTMVLIVAWLDLMVSGLIALSIIFVGQAVSYYEVFSGKILPRRGLFRQWRSAVILALGYGGAVAFAITLYAQPIYIVLLATLTMTIFYALFSWRTYAEREEYYNRLRPFFTSQHLYDNLLTTAPTDLDVRAPFAVLVREVLGARLAHLAPLGSLAPLVPSLAFPGDAKFSAPSQVAQFDAQTICVPIEPGSNGGALWAIPLWSERGLIGVLRLGEKRDGGLYAQEEIEIARASGERLIDTLASAELARRLMALQRQRLAESQLLDRRARRVLHDDILPKLHAAILTLGDANHDAIELLVTAHRETSNLLREMPTSAAPEVARLGLIVALKQIVADEWARAFDSVEWQIENDAEQAARNLPTLTAETIFFAAREAIRNAARYGRGEETTRALHLRIAISARDAFQIIVQDDGVGLHKADSRSEQGAGQGLALHSAMLAVIGGTLALESSAGTRVTIELATS